MSANGAQLGSSLTHHQVTAVAALPDCFACLLKYLLHLNVGKELSVSLLVGLLDSGYHSELSSKSLEALFLCLSCEGVVHIGPLVVLALCSVKKVCCGVAKLAKSLEPKLCVLLLVVCGLLKDSRDLLIALLLCYGCKVGVLVSCLVTLKNPSIVKNKYTGGKRPYE